MFYEKSKEAAWPILTLLSVFVSTSALFDTCTVVDLNSTPVEIGYNGPIRVLYLTINEFPFMQECQRFDSRGGQKEIFFIQQEYTILSIFLFQLS